MYLSVIFLPLINALIIGLGGKWLGRKGVCFVSSMNLGIACLFSFIIFDETVFCGVTTYVEIAKWINFGSMIGRWAFMFDNLSVIMTTMIICIATLVHVYSFAYMREDPHFVRFIAYISLFTFFMLILVCADNLVQLFFGWEGVGLCSYLLINFWFQRLQANKAAFKAIVINRIGDAAMLVAFGLIFFSFQTFDISIINHLAIYKIHINICGFSVIDIICLFLFIGIMAKSAQFGLHTWLPDAMEGPTPVSALIHAATMVTAGVYLLLRCNILFSCSTIGWLVVLVGCLTAIMGATIALCQNDIKKIIAYSTCSQLGYMIAIAGLNEFNASFFHLITHAFFKALLFLCAGSIIHLAHQEQDIRKLNKHNFMSLYNFFLIGNLAITGFPFLSGFYSKDYIIEIAGQHNVLMGHLLYWVGIVTALLTAMYSFRLLYFVFNKQSNTTYNLATEEYFVLFILSLGSIICGYMFSELLSGNSTTVAISTNFTRVVPQKAIVSLFSIVTGLTIFHLYRIFFFQSLPLNDFVYKVYCFLNQRWYIDALYNKVAALFLHTCYIIPIYAIDKGILEIFGPLGLTKTFSFLSECTERLHTGRIPDYFTYTYIFIIIIVLFIIN